jgi:hypothetical protein
MRTRIMLASWIWLACTGLGGAVEVEGWDIQPVFDQGKLTLCGMTAAL